jgi:hypothetical protein
MKTANAWEFLRGLHSVCHFQSRERVGEASNSELKRWIQSQSLVINGERVTPDELMDFHMFSVVLFPKNPVTLL